IDVPPASKLPHAFPPWRKHLAFDLWLRDVVNNEYLCWMPIHEFNCLRKVALKDQNVIAQPDIFELRHSSIEVLTQHVEIVRLVVQNVTNSFELWVVPILFEMRSHSWIDQRNPAHD